MNLKPYTWLHYIAQNAPPPRSFNAGENVEAYTSISKYHFEVQINMLARAN